MMIKIAKKDNDVDLVKLENDIIDAIEQYNLKLDGKVNIKLMKTEKEYFIIDFLGADGNIDTKYKVYLRELAKILFVEKKWSCSTNSINELLVYEKTDFSDMENESKFTTEISSEVPIHKQKIKSICIERYKAINSLNVELSDVNLLIGANNSGKSSMLQAFHLGISALQTYSKCTKSGNFVKSTTVTYDEMLYKPIEQFKLLGHCNLLGRTGNDIRISYMFDDGSEAKISIETGKSRGDTLRLIPNGDLEAISHVANLEENFSYYVTGLSGIQAKEEKKSYALIRELAVKGDSNGVFRNILYLLHQNDDKWIEFLENTNKVFPDYYVSVDYDDRYDKEIMVYVKYKDMKITIDAVGTGVLQFMQMIAYILLFEPKLVILDEPDAHLHPYNQKQVINLLLDICKDKNLQIIISTHSQHIINEVSPKANVIWLDGGNIYNCDEEEDEIREFLWGIGALERHLHYKNRKIKCCVLAEDKKTEYIELLLDANGFVKDEVDIWSYDGCTKDTVAYGIANYISERFNEVKILIHKDRDYKSDEEVEEIKDKFKELDNVEIFFTENTDIESYFVRPSHVKELYESIDIEDINSALDSCIKEMRDDTLNNIAKSRFYHNKNESNYGVMMKNLFDDFDKNPIKYIKGKDLLSRYKGKLHKLIKDGGNPRLNRYSCELKDSSLEDFAKKIW